MQTNYKAFIDDGQIKIVQSDGLEYLIAISKQEKKLKFIKTGLKISIAALTIFILTAFSPLFVSFISGWQIGFFVLCAIVSAFLVGCFASDIAQNENYYDNLTNAYNLAKEELQPQVMQLQKELLKHNTELQQIEAQAKFNFKKPQEMIA